MASEASMFTLTSMPIEDLATDFLALLARLRAAEAEVERVREYLTAAADEARDRAKTAERERDEAWSDLHLVAEAAGAMHDQSIGPSYPGTAEEVTAAIQTLRRERDEARAEIDKLHAITLDVMRERDEARAELLLEQGRQLRRAEAAEARVEDYERALQAERERSAYLMLDAATERDEAHRACVECRRERRLLRAIRDAAEAVDNHETHRGDCGANPCVFCDALVALSAALRAAARGT